VQNWRTAHLSDIESTTIASAVSRAALRCDRVAVRRLKRRTAILCLLRRREEVKSIVDWMDKKQGRGWKKRMQFHDRYMNENIPPRWVRGSVYPRQSSVERLRMYAARFGYGKAPETPVALAPELAVQLANSLVELLAG
jgi:hypothetical protein